MRDFEKRSSKHSENFDRDFSRMQTWGVIMSVATITLSLSLIGFIVWVIIALFWSDVR